jgi:hypothetical protein
MSKINTVLTVIITALFVLPVFAQNNVTDTADAVIEQQKINSAIKNYKKALESENLGMVESAIINVMSLKYHYPDCDYSSLIQPLVALEENDQSKSIRFLSYILKNYLNHPERYAWMEEAHIIFDNDLYAVLAEKVTVQVEK